MPVRGLLGACHPLPCLAVTAFTGAWSAAIGLAPTRIALVMAAVLLGQLSIGWSNDWVDAARDLASGRTDKPIPAGRVSRRAVGRAAGLAVAGCVVTSSALGVIPAAVHLVAVGSAWSYNLGVKSTVVSPLPYAVSFGLLPAVATWAGADPAGWPAGGVVLGAALLGVAAHFANTVPDVAADSVTGVRGLPQRLGPDLSLRVTAGLVAVAALALTTAGWTSGRSSGWTRPVALGLLLAGAGLAVVVAFLGSRARARAFRLTVVAVALVVAGFLVCGGPAQTRERSPEPVGYPGGVRISLLLAEPR